MNICSIEINEMSKKLKYETKRVNTNNIVNKWRWFIVPKNVDVISFDVTNTNMCTKCIVQVKHLTRLYPFLSKVAYNW